MYKILVVVLVLALVISLGLNVSHYLVIQAENEVMTNRMKGKAVVVWAWANVYLRT
ncbi:hypothetical protein GWM83_01505 [Candidatus Bathyarchaeota archaeon]|nr:hypothetical protein [Candidatus Bathyarchaeota archaeon]NIV67599.1 hypothetical protein [Candidatus Bathyarchaeota archaeon]NIW16122.1 hypothetical protein [Candidatus Bathyarchaeota archaeon]NIW34228.1 hypothetical protein [Candidatus Bathyarchaeota archaeon]